MGAMDDRLQRIIANLEEADQSLVQALEARARAIAEYNRLRAEREGEALRLPKKSAVVDAARALAKDFPRDSIEPVFREVLSACTALIKQETVAYVGSPGSFAHEAARMHFGHAAQFRPFESVAAVLEAVQNGLASSAVLPLETASDGAVTATLQGLVTADVKLCAEYSAVTHYQLLSRSGEPERIARIYGDAVAITDCARRLRARHPNATLVDVQSGEVAAHFAKADEQAAAVGTALLKELHGLQTVEDHIEDRPGIRTRFGIVGNRLPSRTGRDRTSLAVAPGDEPGALYRSLQPFADRKINLTRIESRPSSDTDWRHLFFLEMDGHITDRAVLTAVEELRRIARYAKVIGSYPQPS